MEPGSLDLPPTPATLSSSNRLVPSNEATWQVDWEHLPPPVVAPKPLWLVGTLAFLLTPFGNLYLLLWMGLTWAQLKRALQDDSMHPWWHALTPLVPIYGLFQIHAHFALIRDVLSSSGSLVRVHAGRSLVGVMVSFAIGSALNRTEAEGVAYLLGTGVAGLLTAAALVHAQAGLNAYALAIASGPVRVQVHWAEWVVFWIGLSLYLLYVVGVVRRALLFDASVLSVALLLASPIVCGVMVLQIWRQAPLAPDLEARARRQPPPEPQLAQAMERPAGPVSLPSTYRLVITRLSSPVDPVVHALCSLDDTLIEAEARAVLTTVPVEIAAGLALEAALEGQSVLRQAGATAEVR
jgi:hypothetical protein